MLYGPVIPAGGQVVHTVGAVHFVDKIFFCFDDFITLEPNSSRNHPGGIRRFAIKSDTRGVHDDMCKCDNSVQECDNFCAKCGKLVNALLAARVASAKPPEHTEVRRRGWKFFRVTFGQPLQLCISTCVMDRQIVECQRDPSVETMVRREKLW